MLEKYKEILSKKSENLEKFSSSLRNQYSLGKPYPHITIDNFFSEDFLNEILDNFPDLSKIKDSENYKNQNEIKFANNDYNNFPEKIKYF